MIIIIIAIIENNGDIKSVTVTDPNLAFNLLKPIIQSKLIR